jgi:DNA-binding MarR family transcriptional regulator/GNAT superfamily N-acetyltransferase
MRDEMDVLRRFNRGWSQRVGVLDESFLDSGRPLGPSRVLFEIGGAAGRGIGVGELRDRLGLDAGHLSRLLRRLEGEGLVSTTADPDDARRRIARLTPAGSEAWRDLEERSDRIAHDILAPLSDSSRARLADALRTADALIRAATVRFVEVDAGQPEARAAMDAYFAELAERFPGGFDSGPPVDPAAYAPPNGRFFMAASDGVAIACGGIQRIGEGVAEVKRMWVDPTWRGRGIATRLLTHLERTASADGFDVVRLDTNPVHTEASALYRRAGYREIPRYNDNPSAGLWFENAV